MKKKTKKRILLPVDGSDRAFNTVRYITKIEPFYNMKVTLFHVLNGAPESYWDLEKDSRSTQAVRQVKPWRFGQEKKIQQYMEITKQFLLKTGFSEEDVRVKIQHRKKGIARDIIKEAQAGYETVVTRRRGMTGLRGIVLGSVATKLVEKLSFIRVILVGKSSPGNKILIAFDGSDGAFKAVDFVGSILGGFDYKVRLVHVIRGDGKTPSKFNHIYSSKEHTEIVKEKITNEFDKARKRLIKSGFKTHKISTEIITRAHSRARAITDIAKKENYGTIVLGRRGHSQVRDFFIGRVTNKVIHMAREKTVWVIR
jgi:nucleotide-binding universal stress UspA family protein